VAAPILVTGSHRSGTTWVGKMLCRAPGAAYVHEPFSPLRSPGWTGRRIPFWYLYVCPENEQRYAAAFERVLDLRYPIGADLRGVRTARQAGQVALEWPRSLAARARGARVVLKDPIALFSAEWLAKRFGMEVVVMVRHPAAFAGSLKRLNWRFDFRNWAAQPLLMRDHLGPFADEIRAYAERERDIIDQAVLMWNAIHHTIAAYRERHPGWRFVKYEELADRPLEGFRDLARHLRIPWTSRLAAHVERNSAEGNPKEVPTLLHRSVRRDSRAAKRTWVLRLTPQERDRVRAGTAEVAGRFYSDQDWTPA